MGYMRYLMRVSSLPCPWDTSQLFGIQSMLNSHWGFQETEACLSNHTPANRLTGGLDKIYAPNFPDWQQCEGWVLWQFPYRESHLKKEMLISVADFDARKCTRGLDKPDLDRSKEIWTGLPVVSSLQFLKVMIRSAVLRIRSGQRFRLGCF